ncbi:hypothetical protein [Bartonella tamiae]|uniref:hypothetical protein n=1 Tax=Bartonella tamiae TaxID=373638 RepID=UPI00026E77B5|nr:hypothetical protein [Bartonella tamiae]EJF92660.1 hypothetical protein MEG_01830 [Bartonella tamiae Th307]
MVEVIKKKARSKAEKLRLKRGRPRLEGVEREPNGRKSRAKKPKEAADKLTIEMRAKHTGLTLQQAKDPRSVTYIGRLYMMGIQGSGISEDQYNAAIKYLEIDNNYKKALCSDGAYYDGYSPLLNDETQEEFCIKAKQQYRDTKKAIQEAQFDNKFDNLYAALQYVIIEDLELPHLVGTTRLLLNALARHFFLAKTCH